MTPHRATLHRAILCVGSDGETISGFHRRYKFLMTKHMGRLPNNKQQKLNRHLLQQKLLSGLSYLNLQRSTPPNHRLQSPSCSTPSSGTLWSQVAISHIRCMESTPPTFHCLGMTEVKPVSAGRGVDAMRGEAASVSRGIDVPLSTLPLQIHAPSEPHLTGRHAENTKRVKPEEPTECKELFFSF